MECKNTTCSQPSGTAYCSPECKAARVNRNHLVGLPDIRVGMDTQRTIIARAREQGISVHQLLLAFIESEFGDVL